MGNISEIEEVLNIGSNTTVYRYLRSKGVGWVQKLNKTSTYKKKCILGTDLLIVLKDNSFLFYELYSRKYGLQPVFREISFGAKLRCNFAWLNDNSDGPKWVGVLKRKMRKLSWLAEQLWSKTMFRIDPLLSRKIKKWKTPNQ